MRKFCLKSSKNHNKLPIEAKLYEINDIDSVQSDVTDANANDESSEQYEGRVLFNEETHEEENCLIKKLNCIIDINKLSTLILSECSLTNLPDCFEVLRITILDLSHNKLRIVPTCLITGLRRIEELDLSHNYLSNVDYELQCMSYIRKINLEYNNIENCPFWMFSSKCTNLKSFIYNGNLMKELYLIQETFSSVQTLQFFNCNLVQGDLTFFKTFALLKCLHVGNFKNAYKNNNCFVNCDILFYNPLWSDTISILNLQCLKMISLPEELSTFKNLKELNVSCNKLVWLPKSLTQMKSLEILNITQNMITNLPLDFDKLNLKSFIAAENSIISLPKLSKKLKILDLYLNSIFDLTHINLNNIEYIDIEQNYCIVEDHINDYKRKRDKLRLDFNCIDRIDGARIESEDEDVPNESDTTSSLCNSSPVDISFDNCNDEMEKEVWDIEPLAAKNSEITLSDNEWLGNTKNSSKRMLPVNELTYTEESYYYCDVD